MDLGILGQWFTSEFLEEIVVIREDSVAIRDKNVVAIHKGKTLHFCFPCVAQKRVCSRRMHLSGNFRLFS